MAQENQKFFVWFVCFYLCASRYSQLTVLQVHSVLYFLIFFIASRAASFRGEHNYLRHILKRRSGFSRSGLVKENQQICLGLTEPALFI